MIYFQTPPYHKSKQESPGFALQTENGTSSLLTESGGKPQTRKPAHSTNIGHAYHSLPKTMHLNVVVYEHGRRLSQTYF
ncbi:MAG: hypothetical protein LBJ60_09410 [Tannerellaceae bacterium]|nr:hypothetical protein [Tannerellaceae bacterium]